MVTPGQNLPSDDEALFITRPPRNASTLPVTPTRYSSSAPVGSGSSLGVAVGWLSAARSVAVPACRSVPVLA